MCLLVSTFLLSPCRESEVGSSQIDSVDQSPRDDWLFVNLLVCLAICVGVCFGVCFGVRCGKRKGSFSKREVGFCRASPNASLSASLCACLDASLDASLCASVLVVEEICQIQNILYAPFRGKNALFFCPPKGSFVGVNMSGEEARIFSSKSVNTGHFLVKKCK